MLVLALCVLLAASPAEVAVAPDVAPTSSSDPFVLTVPVDVMASREEDEGATATHRVDAKVFQALPYRTAEDALRLVPGLTLVQHGSEGKGHQFFLRGFDAAHGSDLEVRVEGVPLNEWSNIHGQGYVDLGLLIPETVHAVEVLKGAQSLEQGAFAIAGSATYRLGISEDKRGGYASYSLGTTNRHRGVLIYSSADGHDFVAAEALSDAGFGENREITKIAVLGRRTLMASDERELSLFSAFHHSGFALPGTRRNVHTRAIPGSFFDSYDDRASGTSQRALVGLDYRLENRTHALTLNTYVGWRRLRLAENFTGFLFDEVRGDRRGQHHRALTMGMAARDRLQIAHQVWLVTGGGVHADSLRQSQTHLGRDLEPLETHRALEAVQGRAHTFLGLESRLTPALHLSAGGRLDVTYVRAKDLNQTPVTAGSGIRAGLSPRVMARWYVRPSWSVYGGFGRGWRPPEASAWTAYRPRQTGGLPEEAVPHSQPEFSQADTFEMGADWWGWQRRLRLHGAGFASYLEREVVLDHVSGAALELSATQRFGAEASLVVRPLPWAEFGADVTYVEATFRSSGQAIPFVPSLTGNIRALLMTSNGWQLGVRAAGMTPRSLPHGARGTGFAQLDASVGYHGTRLQIDVSVENLLNRRLREGEYHYASDWNPDDGLRDVLPTLHYAAGPPLNAQLRVAARF